MQLAMARDTKIYRLERMKRAKQCTLLARVIARLLAVQNNVPSISFYSPPLLFLRRSREEGCEEVYDFESSCELW